MKKWLVLLLFMILSVSVSACGVEILKFENDGPSFCYVRDVNEYKAKTVVIPSEYGRRTVIGIGDSAFSDCENLTKVTIPDSVEYIGESAFSGCSSLKKITIPASVTSIGENVFGFCDSLKSIKVDSKNPVYHSDGNCIIETATKTLVAGCKNSKIPTDGSVTSIADYAFYGSSMKSIKIPDTVTSIGEKAFGLCDSLTKITIPSSVTNIGNCVFTMCDSLTSIQVDPGNTVYHSAGNCIIETNTKTLITGCKNSEIPTDGSVTGIADYAFYYCNRLTNITIPDSVISIGESAFQYCWGLESITIQGGVETIGRRAFLECSMDKTVYITDLAAWCKTSFEGGSANPACGAKNLFINGEVATDITIPHGVTSICDYAFDNCDGLTSITIPDSVTSIGLYAFSSCSSLTSITIPDGVTSIGEYAFYKCKALTSITIPDSVVSIGKNAFYECNKLWQNEGGVIYVDKWVIDCDESVTSVSLREDTAGVVYGAFSDCGRLKAVHITDLAAWCNISFGSNPLALAHNLYINGEVVTGITIPDGVTSIGRNAFSGWTGLTSITIPDGVTSIGSNAFSGCTGLTSITIPEGITSVGNSAFQGCKNLKEVHTADLTAWCNISFGNSEANPLFYAHNLYINGELATDITIPDGATCIGSAVFAGCNGLTSIAIPDSVTSIGNSAFAGCTGLTSITIPDSVTSIGDSAFFGCTGLTELAIPDTVMHIGKDVFSGCSLTYFEDESGYYLGNANNPCLIFIKAKSTDITSCTIPLRTRFIYSGAFADCVNLTDVRIPNNVISIGASAFSGCSSLTGIGLPANLLSIGESAFYGCTGLTSIAIPETVTSIGAEAFSGDNNLMNIRFAGTKEQWAAIEKGVNWNENVGNDTIYCTDAEV